MRLLDPLSLMGAEEADKAKRRADINAAVRGGSTLSAIAARWRSPSGGGVTTRALSGRGL